ncbi:hypothetical protein [Frankia sp. R43]|uniref:hypothetical protein n=1 Tax=Frankia sp. R43 TaxID=269536 RepID=UPI000ACC1BE5|nr:hypothetical protein [Frankia sp. R43]
MDLIGFIVGMVGFAIGLLQYLNSFKNQRTLRNWGKTLIRRNQDSSTYFSTLADRVEHADREQWRMMQAEIASALRRTSNDSERAAQEIEAYITTVAGTGRGT